MDKRLVGAVGALGGRKVESIMICIGESQVCTPVDLQLLSRHPEKLSWKGDEKNMKAIQEESREEPFVILILAK